MRDWLESMIGRVMARLMYYGTKHQQHLRLQRIEGLAEIDPTTVIADAAGFANPLGDRWRIRMGPKCLVFGEFIVHPEGGEIRLGEHCFVGPNSRLWSAASIRVGDYVLISHDVNIHDNISHAIDLQARKAEIDRVLPSGTLFAHGADIKARPIVIEDHAWIGFGATILGGVTIGRGAIVGAQSMITADVPPGAVVVGNPMRIVQSHDAQA